LRTVVHLDNEDAAARADLQLGAAAQAALLAEGDPTRPAGMQNYQTAVTKEPTTSIHEARQKELNVVC
jgi:hypothetical protein